MATRSASWALLATLAAASATAMAEPDYRASDRFFFGVAGGVSERDPMAGSYAPAGTYETSFWPNDYIGLSTVVAIAGDDTYDVGGQGVLGVPLRWVQPYAGAMAGWRTTPDTVSFRVHPIMGVNGYLSRNARVFVELRDLDVTLVGIDHTTTVVAGLRWSPDWFHRARPVTKIDTVYWSTLLAAGIWMGATLAR